MDRLRRHVHLGRGRGRVRSGAPHVPQRLTEPATGLPHLPARAALDDDRGLVLGSWRALRHWHDLHPWALDLLVLMAVDVIVSARLIHDGTASWSVWLLDQLLVLPLAFRRYRPIGVFALISVVALVQLLVGERLVADIGLLVALYTVAAHESRRRALIAASVLEVGVVLASVRFAPTGDGVAGSIVFLSGLVTTALFLGTTRRARQASLAALVDRAERLERERDQQARLAATAERTRIAREMHDIVAHSVSVIITLADAAALTNATDQPAATRAMQTVSATGRQALGEMRRLLGVLRDEHDEHAELAPQPGLAQLDELMAQMRAAGLPLRVSVNGRPVPLTRTAESVAYRIIQEALTNVLKHSTRPTHVRVLLRWLSDQLAIDVLDDGVAASSSPVTDAPGHGLAGMRERVLVQSGELVTGPRPGGGWAVHARLPLDVS